MKFLRVLIFAIFPAIRKNKFPQIKITANIFPAKIYSRVNILYDLNSLHKNTVQCSITTYLFHSETKRYTMNNWFYIGYVYRSFVWKYVFLLHVLTKKENIINAVSWVLSENRKNYFPARKTNLYCSQKLVPVKYKKCPIRKNKLRQKFRATL